MMQVLKSFSHLICAVFAAILKDLLVHLVKWRVNEPHLKMTK